LAPNYKPLARIVPRILDEIAQSRPEHSPSNPLRLLLASCKINRAEIGGRSEAKSHGPPYVPSDNAKEAKARLPPRSQIEPWLAHRPRILLVGVYQRQGSRSQGNMYSNPTSLVVPDAVQAAWIFYKPVKKTRSRRLL
jgi:hypothetical protein